MPLVSIVFSIWHSLQAFLTVLPHQLVNLIAASRAHTQERLIDQPGENGQRCPRNLLGSLTPEAASEYCQVWEYLLLRLRQQTLGLIKDCLHTLVTLRHVAQMGRQKRQIALDFIRNLRAR